MTRPRIRGRRIGLRGDRRGIAGFFEEIPLLTIVIIGLSVFLASLFSAYSLYVGALEALRFRENAQDFAESLYADSRLTGDGPGGRFIAASLTEDVRAELETDFQPINLGFHYNVTVSDVSDYPDRFTWYAGESAAGRDVRTITKPLVIVDGDLAHPSLLIVKVWR